jgi:hypothetical protein
MQTQLSNARRHDGLYTDAKHNYQMTAVTTASIQM